MSNRLGFALLALVACQSAAPNAPNAPRATAVVPVEPDTPLNPVIDEDFADPAVLRVGDGFWVYGTQLATGTKHVNLQVAHTRDLAAFEAAGDALPVKPAWASHTQDFWAPHVVANGPADFVLYFAAQPDTKAGMCIGVARARVPSGPFTDIGAALVCGKGFITIDPFVLDDPATKKRFLYWGSNSAPLVARELTADGLRFAAGSAVVEVLRPDPSQPYENLIEAPWIVVRDGQYFLFYSGDNCCGKNAHYAVLVAKGPTALGPFTRRDAGHGGPVLLEGSARWKAPGHNAVATDARGQDWIVYHAIDSRHPTQPCPVPASAPCGADGELPSRRPLLVDRLRWEDGWPRVEGRSASTSARPTSAP